MACEPCRPGGVSKIDMSDDTEHTLTKVDVVLTFAVEVSASGALFYAVNFDWKY